MSSTNHQEQKMNKFYINGQPASKTKAFETFRREHEFCDEQETSAMWAECQVSEEARDSYLPSELEIIAN